MGGHSGGWWEDRVIGGQGDGTPPWGKLGGQGIGKDGEMGGTGKEGGRVVVGLLLLSSVMIYHCIANVELRVN